MLPAKLTTPDVRQQQQQNQHGSEGHDDPDNSANAATADAEAPSSPAGFSPEIAATTRPSTPPSPPVTAASTAAGAAATVDHAAPSPSPSRTLVTTQLIGDNVSNTPTDSNSIRLSLIPRQSVLPESIMKEGPGFVRQGSVAGASSSEIPEEDNRSPTDFWSDKSHEGGGAGGYYAGGATGEARHAGMPRNFRIAVDGYSLQRDDDGTFAAYRINVTAGLYQWQVLRRYVSHPFLLPTYSTVSRVVSG